VTLELHAAGCASAACKHDITMSFTSGDAEARRFIARLYASYMPRWRPTKWLVPRCAPLALAQFDSALAPVMSRDLRRRLC
jgi:hypothetical protein